MASLLMRSSIDYNYVTKSKCERCNSTQNERILGWPRGKVMGGSSTVNSMWYVRGNKQDFDDWAQMGNVGWSWRDVLPYFKKSEDARDPVSFNLIE